MNTACRQLCEFSIQSTAEILAVGDHEDDKGLARAERWDELAHPSECYGGVGPAQLGLHAEHAPQPCAMDGYGRQR